MRELFKTLGYVVLWFVAYAFLCALLGAPVHAREGGPFNITPSGWDRETQVSESVYQLAHAVDCLQTYEIASHPERWQEQQSSWLLGDHPQKPSVVVWCLATAYAHGVITQALHDGGASPTLRRIWQVTSIGLTVNTVSNNYSIGIRVGF